MSVVNLSNSTILADQIKTLELQFAAQLASYQQQTNPTYAERMTALKALQQGIRTHMQVLNQAMSIDFGHRDPQESTLVDILPCLEMIRHTQKRLKKWMKPSRRSAGLVFFPAKVAVHYQPLGVIGIVVPWNAPLTLSLIPLATALAAGNRVMLKMSELSPQTNACVKAMLAECFSPEQVCVVEGNVDLARAFCQLPFDHLLFTGASHVGKDVMRAAAENLTPLTLELGGKSPVIVAPDIELEQAAKNILFGKALNAGQLCIAPDHVYIPEDKLDPLIKALQQQWQIQYPNGILHPDQSAIISHHHFDRLKHFLDEAQAGGASIIPLSQPAQLTEQKKMALHLVINPPANCQLMQQEIFGPILPILTYQAPYQLLTHLRKHPRPLALYLMTRDEKLKQYVIHNTHSGGLAINDTVTHVGLNDAPFGGIGASGFGHYHGIEGFQRFSHAKTVLQRYKFNPTIWLCAPYQVWWKKIILKWLIR